MTGLSLQSWSLRSWGWITLLLALGAITVVGTAWGFQLIGGFVPCKLCLEQRLGYYFAVPLLMACGGMLLAREPRRGDLRKMIAAGIGIAGLLLLWSAGIGAFQAGAEWGFWPGPTDCGGGAIGGGVSSGQSLIEAMEATRLVPCDEAAGRFLGLSFAGWNVVAAGGLAFAALVAAFQIRKAD